MTSKNLETTRACCNMNFFENPELLGMTWNANLNLLGSSARFLILMESPARPQPQFDFCARRSFVCRLWGLCLMRQIHVDNHHDASTFDFIVGQTAAAICLLLLLLFFFF